MRSRSTSSLLNTVSTAGIDIFLFLLYVLVLHVTGMSVKMAVTGDPWDPWSAPWNSLLHLTGDDKWTLWVFGTTTLTTVFYWLASAGYLLLDLTTPSWIMRYKVQPDKNTPVDKNHILSVLLLVLFNQVVLGPPAAALSYRRTLGIFGTPQIRS